MAYPGGPSARAEGALGPRHLCLHLSLHYFGQIIDLSELQILALKWILMSRRINVGIKKKSIGKALEALSMHIYHFKQ